MLSSTSGGSLDDCFDGCTTDDACNYWSFDLDSGNCSYYAIQEINFYYDMMNFVSGPKFCAGATSKADYIFSRRLISGFPTAKQRSTGLNRPTRN